MPITHRRRFTVPVAPDVVHALLGDPRRIPELHPLADQVEVTFEGREGDEHVVRFTIDEHVPLWGLSIPNRYTGEARWKDTSALSMRGWSKPAVTVAQEWRFHAKEGGTDVEQTSTITAPWGLGSFVGDTAKAAHDAMIERLKKVCAERASAPPAPPAPRWLEPGANPWGVRVLDVRPVTQTLLSTSNDRAMAENLTSMFREDGVCFVGQPPKVDRNVPAELRYPVAGPVADGVLFAPEAMEDKWGIYLHRGRVIVVRSWTRAVHLVAEAKVEGDHLVLGPLHGAIVRAEEAPEHTVAWLDFLIRTHVLRSPHPVPLFSVTEDPGIVAMQLFSMFGRRVEVAVEQPVPGLPLTRPIRTNSLLHIAVARGDLATVDRQLDVGVSIDLLARDGLPPLQWALTEEMREHLLARGAAVDGRSAEGATALMTAAQQPDPAPLRRLLAAGADVNAVDARGFSALHRACEIGHVECVRVLLAAGADPDCVAQGETPRSLAKKRDRREVLDALGDVGAS